MDWTSLKCAANGGAQRALESLDALADRWTKLPTGWSGIYRVAGGGIDFLVIHFRETLDQLIETGRRLQLSPWGEFATVQDEYLSVVELGLYGLTKRVAERVDPRDHEAWSRELRSELAAEGKKDFVRRRLEPVQPGDMPYVCYYPMDKRRESGQNWYALTLEERAALMVAHGEVGRRYAGRIVQVISGSMGLDDWEWAVTLWAADPLDFKAIITEMRYDAVSARYAEFGPFLVGKRLPPGGAADLLAGGER